MDLNKATLIGNLTRDPESRTTPNGATVTTFGLATNLVWTDASGTKQKRPEFHNIVAWRKLGEICAQYLRKGHKVYIEGRIQYREWQAQDGTKKNRTEIVTDNMIMLDARGMGSGPRIADAASASTPPTTQAPAAPSSSPSVEAESAPNPDEEIRVEDIPF